MKNIKRVTILENDRLHKHCPLSHVLTDAMEAYPNTTYTVWDWFYEDVRQNTEKSFARLKELSADTDHEFLVYTNFVGAGNGISSWVGFLNKLHHAGIRLKINLIFSTGKDGDTLDNAVRKEMFSYKGYQTCSMKTDNLLTALDSHEIKFQGVVDTMLNSETPLEHFQPITRETIMSKYFKKGDKARVIETGEILEVTYSFYWNKGGHIDLCVNPELDAQEGWFPEAYKQFEVEQLEKI